MADEVRKRLKGTGTQQRSILLWLGDRQGVRTPAELRSRWPKTLNLVAEVTRGVGRPFEAATEFAPYLEDEYFLGRSLSLEAQGWTRWSAEAFLGGRPPTNGESAALSKAIRSLERRGLVEAERAGFKQKHVTHVRLTFYGEVASVLLRAHNETKARQSSSSTPGAA